MPEAMIKGSAIRGFVEAFEKRHGKEVIRRMAASAPPDLRAHLDPDDPTTQLMAASWYPARLAHLMLDALAEDHSEQEIERLAKEASREIVRNSMNGAYHYIFQKLATPQMYALLLPRMWRQLHSTGERSLTLLGPGRAESRIARWPGHHAVLCMLTNQFMCAIFEEMGCRNVRWKRRTCVSRDGGTECITDVTWLEA
jgi:hypothetical protein